MRFKINTEVLGLVADKCESLDKPLQISWPMRIENLAKLSFA